MDNFFRNLAEDRVCEEKELARHKATNGVYRLDCRDPKPWELAGLDKPVGEKVKDATLVVLGAVVLLGIAFLCLAFIGSLSGPR